MTHDTGFFVMKDAAEVLKLDLDGAKNYLRERISSFLSAHPNVKKENLLKAEQMIVKGTNVRTLSMSVANFVLAHTSENLAVIK